MALKPITNFLLPTVKQGSVQSLVLVDDNMRSFAENEAASVLVSMRELTSESLPDIYTHRTLHNHQQDADDNDVFVMDKENHEPSDAKGKIAAINSIETVEVAPHAAAPEQEMSLSPFPSPSRLGYKDSRPLEWSAYACSYTSASASQTSNVAALYHPQVLNAVRVEDTISLDKKVGMPVVVARDSQLPKQALYKTTNLASLEIARAEVSCTADGSPPKQKHVRWTKEEDDVLLKAVPLYTLQKRNKPVIDWKRLAQRHFQGIRSNHSCKNRYYQLIKNGLNRAPLSRGKNKPINQEQRLKDSNFEAFSSSLSDSSVSEMHSDFDDGPSVQQQRKCHLWMEEEDSLLVKAVNKCSNRLGFKPETIDWKRIARTHFQGTRSARQCQWHYQEYLKPGLKHGPFIKEENLIIVQGAAENKTWNVIAVLLSGKRHEKVIQDRWTNQLDPELKRGPFTDEEKEILVHAHEYLGNKWTKDRRAPPRQATQPDHICLEFNEAGRQDNCIQAEIVSRVVSGV